MKQFAMINQQALIAAADALRRDDHTAIAAMGLSDIREDLAKKLKRISLSDIGCANDFRAPILHVTFDLRNTELFLDFATTKGEEEELIMSAIAGGMRQGQLNQLTGIGRRDFDERRKRIGLCELAKGPIENLSEEDEINVLREWELLKDIPSLLSRYVELHRRTRVRLDRAWVCINQYAG